MRETKEASQSKQNCFFLYLNCNRSNLVFSSICCLQIVLAIGNYLNGTSFRGNAHGFQLDALLKMRDTKAIENNARGTSTLLHYLANTLEEKQRDLITFMDELQHLEVAARVSVVTLMASVNSLETGVAQIKEEIRVLKRIRLSPENDKFIEVMGVSF